MEAQFLRGMHDISSWIRLAPLLSGRYLPFSVWSLRPSALVRLLDDISLNDREVVMECGSGTSTVVLARMMAQRGRGSVLSLEHDKKWASWVESQLAAEGLTDIATVVHAPLAAHTAGLDSVHWYDPGIVTAEVGAFTAKNGPIDVLLVDGPPGGKQGSRMSRYPAVPVLREYLASDAFVMLDDVNRSEGVEITKLWAKEHGLELDLDPYGTRTAFGALGGGS